MSISVKDLQALPKALYSLNVVLPNKFETQPAAILIKDDFIIKVIESPSPYDEITVEYPDYNWQDLSDYFINPGLIDLNVCFNSDFSLGDEDTFENENSAFSENSACLTSLLPDTLDMYEQGTKSAISNGVTLIIDSPSVLSPYLDTTSFSHKLESFKKKSLYCDIAALAYMSSENLSDLEEFSALGAIGFKSYIIPVGYEIPYLTSDKIGIAMESLSRLNKPVFLHPEKANERYLYMSSPFRNETLSSRKYKPEPAFAAFPAAFPEEVEDSGSEISPISLSNTPPTHLTPSSLSRPEDLRLEKRIIHQSNDLESLIKAEIMTYSISGLTYFNSDSPLLNFKTTPKKSPLLPHNSPVRALPLELKPRRPPPITCSKPISFTENTDYKIFLANCPPHWEVNGVQSIISELKSHPTCRVHICNLSSANAVYAIKKHKKEHPHLKLTCETSSFYLHFSEENIKPGDTRFKANPPIREEKNRQLLIDILAMGGVDVVSSCHKSVEGSLKFRRQGDFKRAISGVDSIGSTLQVANGVFRGENKLRACKIAKVSSENPAEVLGLGYKGKIEEGRHADLVVWRPDEASDCIVGARKDMCPFIGERMTGKVWQTYLRGKLAYSVSGVSAFGKAI